MTNSIETKLPGYFKLQKKCKVRDVYRANGETVLITTNRQSAHDRVVGNVAHKGAVLNLLSSWWFRKTSSLVPSHFVAQPDPNVTIARTVDVVPIEIVVRGYLTGTTATSIWTAYKRGERRIYGIELPDGMKRDQKLGQAVITPTLKRDDGDVPISAEDILSQGIVPESTWTTICKMALDLFEFGRAHCETQGIILVDTKYEFGIALDDADGSDFIICDEVHTPDSSRFWILDTYDERFSQGQDPERLDKDSLRVYMNEHGANKSIPDEIMDELSRNYIAAYERITGEVFPPIIEEEASQRISDNLSSYYKL